MNKFNLSALAIIASVALTACGGGGGNDSNNNQPKESTINQTTVQSNWTIPGYDFPPLDVEGHKIDKDNHTLGTIEMSLDRSVGADKMLAENRRYSWNGIIVKHQDPQDPSVGQQLINLDPRIQLNTETNRANLSSLGLNPDLNHTFKGYIVGFKGTVFYQAMPTPDTTMPTSGKATYKGNAIRYDMVSLRGRGVGETELNVDFANKTIEGKITTEDHRRNIILQQASLGTMPENTRTESNSTSEEKPKIPSAVFSGKAIAEGNLIYPDNVEGTYSGTLAGPFAEEAGGLVDFGSTEHVSGESPISFSAVKQ